MLRVIGSILLFIGIWTTIQALAYLRSPPEDEAVTSVPKLFRPPSAISVPVELMQSARWAKVSDPDELAEAEDDGKKAGRAPVEQGEGDTAEAAKDEERLETAAIPPESSGTATDAAPAQQKPESQVRPAAATLPKPALKIPDEAELAAAIQTKLRELGHYRGQIDNIWGGGSRAALRRFNRAQNVDLPLEPTADVYRALLDATQEKAREGQAQPAAVNRPAYLPPWMRGEGAPRSKPQNTRKNDDGPRTNMAVAAPRPDPEPQTRRRSRRSVVSVNAQRAEQRRAAARQQGSRPRRSLNWQLRNSTFHWPGE